MKISDVDFSIRTKIVLESAGIETLEELAQKSDTDLLKLRNCGNKTVEEVEKVLAEHGLSLKNKFIKKQRFIAGVKIMNSYDYSHFEITLSSDQKLSITEINNMRKEAQRLVDESIRQYKRAKEIANMAFVSQSEIAALQSQVMYIRTNKPQSEWTLEDKVKIKHLQEYVYYASHNWNYDYEDDWEDLDENIF